MAKLIWLVLAEWTKSVQFSNGRTSLVVQWLSIHLPMQGTWVQSLVWEDSTCCEAIRPTCHNAGPVLEPVPRDKRSPSSERPPLHS